MTDQKNRPETAVIFKIEDTELQRFFQMDRYSTAKDADLKKRALAALRDKKNWEFRESKVRRNVEALNWESLDMNDEEKARLAKFFEEDKTFTEASIFEQMKRIGWRMAFLPEKVDDVLVLGPGSGIEIAYLWAKRPGCRVTGVDLYDRISSNVKAQPNFTFEEGMVAGYLSKCTNNYDLIFSNQVFEHLNTIDEVLSSAFKALRPGGWLVAGLPLEGDLANPLRDEMLSLVHSCENIHPVDIPRLNLGHPWKTNASDIHATLTKQGFRDVRVFTRDDHSAVQSPYCIEEAYKKARQYSRKFQIAHKPLSKFLKTVCPHNAPSFLIRALDGYDQRGTPWALQRILYRTMLDVALVAKKPL